jgi:hypothetical protein
MASSSERSATREPELQLDADPRTAHRPVAAGWQRLRWSVLALVVLAALAGLLGPGPVSDATATAPDGQVEVRYERFTHWVGSTSVELQVAADPAQPDQARVWISQEYLSGLQLEQVQPEPDSWTAMDDGVVLAFPVTGPEPLSVELQVRPAEIGLLRGAVGVPGRDPLRFWQFVYP